MTSMGSAACVGAAATSLALAAWVVARRVRGRVAWSFALGMLGFAGESLAIWVLLAATEQPEDRLFWLQITLAVGLLLLIPWAFFAVRTTAAGDARWGVPQRIGLGFGGLLVIAALVAVGAFPAFQISETPGPFHAARYDVAGRYAVMVQLLGTAVVLAGLELSLRTSRGVGRWRLKYLILGLGGVFLVRFYFLSQMLLFHVVMASYLATAAATLVLGNLVVAGSLVRDRFAEVELHASPRLLYRSVVVSVLGMYLVAVATPGWALGQLGVSEEIVWSSVITFVSAIGLGALLLSENLRWRIRRVIGMHVYHRKYDYREQWIEFTKRLARLLEVRELAAQLLRTVTEAVGTARAVLYLTEGRGGPYRLVDATWVEGAPESLEQTAPVISLLQREPGPVIALDSAGPFSPPALPSALREAFPEGSVAVPLRWQDSLLGLMLLGPERTGVPYRAEDAEFLATVAEQAAGALATAQLSGHLARAREFEAFHRLTSFVIHDLKNSISGLSLLAQNAMSSFDDPEFRSDAVQALVRTVDGMKALLARLSATPRPMALALQPVDLTGIAAEATLSLAGAPRVKLVKEFGPVGPVSADREAMLRVTQNLVTNAVEAVDGNGTVAVRTYSEDGWAVVSVTDTGCGMSKEFLRDSLFTPFRTTKKGGWGIGLYQSQSIVEGHGGRIDVASREGQGTTFWIRLPLAADRSRPADEHGSG